MYKEKLLMTSGPTMLPPRVLEALGRQLVHQGTSEFEVIFDELEENLKYVFQTKNEVMIFASSGTGAMESTIVNLFSPGERVLVLSTGAYGDRYAEIATQFGLIVDKMSFEWGSSIDIEQVRSKIMDDNRFDIKAIIMTHNETSTGVTNDVEAVSKLTRHSPRMLIVDAISSIGAIDLKMDVWGIDAVVTGSHKAFMSPPGLSFVSLSDKAWESCHKATLPRFYWDYRKYKNSHIKETYENPPYTPAISLMVAQSEALKMIREEGIENVFTRHKRLSYAAQEGILALGLKLFPERNISSNIITVVKSPAKIDIEQARKLINMEYDIMVTEGHQNLTNNIFRIGHCGYVNVFDLMKTFTAFEYILQELGYRFEMGASVKKVQEFGK